MSVWAIADLHLDFANTDRIAKGNTQGRERYAERWRDHPERIDREWRQVVQPTDIVLIPGDISMARNHRDLQPDLNWLERLPGWKVLSPGNHDAWWNGAEKVRPLLRRSQTAVGGDAIEIGGAIVCGTKGAPVLPDEPTAKQLIDSDAELESLDRALESANKLRQKGQPLYVLWHYPPFDQHKRPGPCVARFEAANVTACVYGHLHIEGQWSLAVQGIVGTVKYACVAADAVGFRPLRIDGVRR